MKSELEKLEQTVEREMKLLAHLPEGPPSTAGMRRLRQAIRDEAARYRSQQRVLTLVRSWGGIAAAVLLALGLTLGPAITTNQPDADPEAVLADWASAWDESRDRLTSVLDEGWSTGGNDAYLDEAGEIDELFESWDTSLDQFDSL